MQIFDFFLSMVRHYAPDSARQEFRIFFFEYRANAMNAGALADLQALVAARDRQTFLNTLKRCCYILVNNWETKRASDCVVALVEDFEALRDEKRSLNPERARLQGWVQDFVDSQDYEDLRLFAIRHDHHGKLDRLGAAHWSQRYTSYLLVPQYADSQNSPEQRQAARQISQQLKKKFKFDLAMYTARSQSPLATPNPERPERPPLENPTGLGDQVLKLIKRLIVRRGQFSHANLARIFLKQVEAIDYVTFKDALYNYLVFAVDARDPDDRFHRQLYERLRSLYPQYNDRKISPDAGLMLRTCNRLCDLLTVEDGEQPSPLFILLLSQGNPLMLATMLLKVALICPSARTHLESRIAVLVRYYMQFPEDECHWAINFFDIFNIAFAIYADRDVQYNIVHYDEAECNDSGEIEKRQTYRIFSQHTRNSDRRLTDAEVDPLEISP